MKENSIGELKMKVYKSDSGGFTLIELMIVIAIIAIIVTLALPAYQDYSIRTKVGEALSVSAAAKTAGVETCQSDPLANPSTESGYQFVATAYVASVVIWGDDCPGLGMTVTTQNTGAVVDPVLRLYPPTDGGNESWACEYTAGLARHVPSTCRNVGGLGSS